MKRATVWPIVIGLSALGIGVLAGFDIDSPLRPVLSLWFLLVCTGMSFVRLLDIKDAVVELVLAIGLSIAISTLLSEILVLSEQWMPVRGLYILIGLSLVGVMLQVVVPSRRFQAGEVAPEASPQTRDY